jgi:hypothetical protein
MHIDPERPEFDAEHEEHFRDPAAPLAAFVSSQKLPASLTDAHDVSNEVVIPPITDSPKPGFRFMPFSAAARIHEYLFEVRRGPNKFWVGAAVPEGTTDFTQAQVFFHPTVVQNGIIRADDKDYPNWTGGWSERLQKYIPRHGGQLGAKRKVPLIIPFMTMKALKTTKGGGMPADNIFRDHPVQTLNTIIQAVQKAAQKGAGSVPTLKRIGVASYSSGITAMRLFLSVMKTSGLVREIYDFDSPYITAEPKMLTRLPGASSKCFTQKALAREPVGYISVRREHFENIIANDEYPEPQRTHARIGWMMYYQAMEHTWLR